MLIAIGIFKYCFLVIAAIKSKKEFTILIRLQLRFIIYITLVVKISSGKYR
jgi:hypothetical protein